MQVPQLMDHIFATNDPDTLDIDEQGLVNKLVRPALNLQSVWRARSKLARLEEETTNILDCFLIPEDVSILDMQGEEANVKALLQSRDINAALWVVTVLESETERPSNSKSGDIFNALGCAYVYGGALQAAGQIFQAISNDPTFRNDAVKTANQNAELLEQFRSKLNEWAQTRVDLVAQR